MRILIIEDEFIVIRLYKEIKRSSLRSPIAEKKSRRVRKRRSLRDFIVSTNRETAPKVVMALNLPSQRAS